MLDIEKLLTHEDIYTRTVRIFRPFRAPVKIQRYRKKLIDRAIDEIFTKYDKIKLHMACGSAYKEGWINIDKCEFRTDKKEVKVDISFDLTQEFPFPQESVDFIYNEHFIEHLDVEKGYTFLCQCLNILKPGGVLRIATPSIKPVIDQYYMENWQEQEWIKKAGMTFVRTKAELVNLGFRCWGHQWLYDEEELRIRLQDAGFKNIKLVNINQSDYPELQNIETREESNLIMEAVKE